MKTDPTFTTREELEVWATGRAKAAWPYSRETMRKAVEDVRRVTIAHSHLLAAGPIK